MTALASAKPMKVLRDALPYVSLVLLVIFFSFASEYFLDLRNFQRLATDSATLLIAAMAMTLVILLGEIDLSVGAVTALLSVIAAQLMAAGWAWCAASLATLAIALGIGALNGVVTAYGRIHSFVVTLGVNAIATGLAYLFTGAISVAILDTFFLDFFYSVTFSLLPVPLWIVLTIFAALTLLLTRTSFGRELFAMGANPVAAALCGIRLERNKVMVFALAGLLVGIGALLSASRLGSGGPNSSPSLTLDAIAAVIIGGASLFGGRASIHRTLLGGLLIGVLNNGMVLMNVNADAQYIVKGLIILLAVVLERLAAGTDP